jgi:6-phosphogluconolactonase (cycloisomerase 2 family)
VTGSPFAAGGGPTSTQIDPNGKFLYVSCDTSNNVYAFQIGKTGALTAVAGSPFGSAGDGPGGISLSPSGKFAYVPSYTLGSVWGFTISAKTGALTPVGDGWPAGSEATAFAVDSTNKFGYAVNYGAGNISAYKIGSSGALTAVTGSPFGAGSGPGWMAICEVAKGVCKPPPL